MEKFCSPQVAEENLYLSSTVFYMTYKNMFSDSGHISIPPILALHDSKITSPGDLGKIELLCKQVHELDLTKNSITDWEQVTKLNVHCISVATMLNDQIKPIQ